MSNRNDLQPINGGETSKKSAVRCKDLSTRERVNFVLSSTIMEKLRERSTKDQIPMSRIIDAALMSYLNNPISSFVSSSLETGIILYHLLELLLTVKYESVFAKNIMNYTQKYFEHFTFTSCLIKSSIDEATLIGTKIILFISDDQNKSLSDFIDEMSKLEDKQYMEVFLDGKQVNV